MHHIFISANPPARGDARMAMGWPSWDCMPAFPCRRKLDSTANPHFPVHKPGRWHGRRTEVRLDSRGRGRALAPSGFHCCCCLLLLCPMLEMGVCVCVCPTLCVLLCIIVVALRSVSPSTALATQAQAQGRQGIVHPSSHPPIPAGQPPPHPSRMGGPGRQGQARIVSRSRVSLACLHRATMTDGVQLWLVGERTPGEGDAGGLAA